MSGKTDVQFFYVIGITNENPGSNQSLASVRVLFDGGTDRLPPCRTGANTFYIVAIRFCMCANRFCTLQYDFVCVQTRFTPCNTISYACKHVLRLATRFCMCANTFCALQYDFVCVQTRFTSLQQLIRWAKWAFTSLQHGITAM